MKFCSIKLIPKARCLFHVVLDIPRHILLSKALSMFNIRNFPILVSQFRLQSFDNSIVLLSLSLLPLRLRVRLLPVFPRTALQPFDLALHVVVLVLNSSESILQLLDGPLKLSGPRGE